MAEFSKYDIHFMRVARENSLMSKDPSSKVGVVIARDRHIVGSGWNGFPTGIADNDRLQDRGKKLELTVHAEMNAILHAGHLTRGAALYQYGFKAPPCSDCTKHIIQAGIKKVISCGIPIPDRWRDSFAGASCSLAEAGVELLLMDELELAEFDI